MLPLIIAKISREGYLKSAVELSLLPLDCGLDCVNANLKILYTATTTGFRSYHLEDAASKDFLICRVREKTVAVTRIDLSKVLLVCIKSSTKVE